MIARGMPKLPKMNRLERKYDAHLEMRRRIGEVAWYRYEGIKLRLADGAFFTPDFFVMLATGELQVHETKGFMREAANVRLKIAAEMYPFRFLLIRSGKQSWDVTEINGSPSPSQP